MVLLGGAKASSSIASGVLAAQASSTWVCGKNSEELTSKPRSSTFGSCCGGELEGSKGMVDVRMVIKMQCRPAGREDPVPRRTKECVDDLADARLAAVDSEEQVVSTGEVARMQHHGLPARVVTRQDISRVGPERLPLPTGAWSYALSRAAAAHREKKYQPSVH